MDLQNQLNIALNSAVITTELTLNHCLLKKIPLVKPNSYTFKTTKTIYTFKPKFPNKNNDSIDIVEKWCKLCSEQLVKTVYDYASSLAFALMTKSICPMTGKGGVYREESLYRRYRYVENNKGLLDSIEHVLEKNPDLDYITFSSSVFKKLMFEKSVQQWGDKFVENFGNSMPLTRNSDGHIVDAGFIRQVLSNRFGRIIEVYDGSYWRNNNMTGEAFREKFLPNDTILFSNSKKYLNQDSWNIIYRIEPVQIEPTEVITMEFYLDAIQYEDGLTACMYINTDEY